MSDFPSWLVPKPTGSLKTLARLGGIARMAQMTPRQRYEHQYRAGRALATGRTAKERKAAASVGGKALAAKLSPEQVKEMMRRVRAAKPARK